jgi:hypothetical protein
MVAIKVGPSTKYLPLAGVRQLIATGVYSDGTQIDITSQVTWSASSASIDNPAGINFLQVNSSGLVTGLALGPATVSATAGNNIGLLALTVTTNGYASSTFGTLVVPFGSSEIDVAYLPRFQGQIQGTYTVQELNLDADQFSSVLPVPSALIASIPMPSGFVPNITAASQASLLVAVMSYTSPNIEIIDASNTSIDTSSNTIISSFKAPVTKKVAFNGKTCMICAAVVDPSTDRLILSTAQGYYTMDLVTGAFTALPLASPGFPAPGFTVNPLATIPYIVSPTFGQDPNFPNEVQVLNLPTSADPTGAVTNYTNFGLTAPNTVAINLTGNAPVMGGPVTNDVVVVDAGANDEAFVTLGNSSQTTTSTLVSNQSLCTDSPPGATLDMAAFGIPPSPGPTQALPPILFLSAPSGDCVGFEILSSIFDAPDTTYGYGILPTTPDGNKFVNSGDPNAIATFSTVFGSGTNYGLLADANQNWLAKLNLVTISSDIPQGFVLPQGFDISTALDMQGPGSPVEYLPTPATIAILSQYSIPFGSQAVGTSSIQIQVVLTNINTTPLTNLNISGIAIDGTNSGDFAQTNTCGNLLAAQAKCTILVDFTPSAMGARSATLTITDDGGESPQIVTLTGTGT